MPFVSRIILQSLLHGCPSDLVAEGNQLSTLIKPLIEKSVQASGSEDIFSKFDEICPACGVDMPLEDITTAVCANGHNWRALSRRSFEITDIDYL